MTSALPPRSWPPSPLGGSWSLIWDFSSFLWFDDFTASHRFFVTRMREKTAYRTVHELSSGPSYRDEIIQMGQYRSNPCQHPVRMVSVLWQGVWYRSLTNVLEYPMCCGPGRCASCIDGAGGSRRRSR